MKYRNLVQLGIVMQLNLARRYKEWSVTVARTKIVRETAISRCMRVIKHTEKWEKLENRITYPEFGGKLLP